MKYLITNGPAWWTGAGWTPNPASALKYPAYADAQVCVAKMRLNRIPAIARRIRDVTGLKKRR